MLVTIAWPEKVIEFCLKTGRIVVVKICPSITRKAHETPLEGKKLFILVMFDEQMLKRRPEYGDI
jgi:hypothetical protein